MRSLLVSCVLSAGIVGATACSGGGVWSPSDPREFDRSMFDESALSAYSTGDSGYVMGHAIGVYLMGKTVPGRVAYKGYLYRPGWSSPELDVPYEWERVLVARSGGSDGNGGVIYDDVGVDPTPTGPGGPFNPTEEAEPGTPSDDVDVDNDPTEPGGPGDPDDPNDPGSPDGPGGDHDPNDCGIIEHACAAVLAPPTNEARALAELVDPARFAPAGLDTAAQAEFAAAFERGLWQALAEVSYEVWHDGSESAAVVGDVKSYGLCDD